MVEKTGKNRGFYRPGRNRFLPLKVEETGRNLYHEILNGKNEINKGKSCKTMLDITSSSYKHIYVHLDYIGPIHIPSIGYFR